MLSDEDSRRGEVFLDIDNADGKRFGLVAFHVCPNPKCRKFTMYASLAGATDLVETTGGHTYRSKDYRPKLPSRQSWRLVPWSSARVFPEFIPQQIRSDYTESCAIRDLSPKASATLARRCLQGMIRDFWKIKEDRLAAAIKALETRVDSTTWKAIDAVRKVGNIGAHMEKDVNLVVDVEPAEAQKLLTLIEMLLDEWYVARQERGERAEAVIAIAEEKAQSRKRKSHGSRANASAEMPVEGAASDGAADNT
jgi:hypothetical protein